MACVSVWLRACVPACLWPSRRLSNPGIGHCTGSCASTTSARGASRVLVSDAVTLFWSFASRDTLELRLRRGLSRQGVVVCCTGGCALGSLGVSQHCGKSRGGGTDCCQKGRREAASQPNLTGTRRTRGQGTAPAGPWGQTSTSLGGLFFGTELRACGFVFLDDNSRCRFGEGGPG